MVAVASEPPPELPEWQVRLKARGRLDSKLDDWRYAALCDHLLREEAVQTRVQASEKQHSAASARARAKSSGVPSADPEATSPCDDFAAMGTLRAAGTLWLAENGQGDDAEFLDQKVYVRKSQVQPGVTIKDSRANPVYRVGKKLGSGGFGTVFLGTQLPNVPGREVLQALKVLQHAHARVDACKEALIQLRLGIHPHRCCIRRVLLLVGKNHSKKTDEDALGELLIGMDLAGDELQSIIFESVSGGTPNTKVRGALFDLGEGSVQRRALRYSAQLAAALEATFSSGYLHCDVGPK